jgi:hypothetical protein
MNENIHIERVVFLRGKILSYVNLVFKENEEDATVKLVSRKPIPKNARKSIARDYTPTLWAYGE